MIVYNSPPGRTSHPKILTISEIGVIRFWTGVFLGIGFTIMLYLLISSIRDMIPLMIARFYRPFLELVVTGTQRYIHNLFVAGLACVLGQNIALRIWLDKGCYEHKNTHTRRHCIQVIGRLGLAFNGTLLFLAGMSVPWGFYLASLRCPYYPYLYSLSTHNPLPEPPPTILVLHTDHLEYWLLLILFLFFFQYMNVRTMYRCGRLMLVFFLITVIAAAVLANINIV